MKRKIIILTFCAIFLSLAGCNMRERYIATQEERYAEEKRTADQLHAQTRSVIDALTGNEDYIEFLQKVKLPEEDNKYKGREYMIVYNDYIIARDEGKDLMKKLNIKNSPYTYDTMRKDLLPNKSKEYYYAIELYEQNNLKEIKRARYENSIGIYIQNDNFFISQPQHQKVNINL
jgi:hypothetical protein